MARVNLDDDLWRWVRHGTPLSADALDDAAKHEGGTKGDGTTNLQHVRLAGNYVAGRWLDKVRPALLDFYERCLDGHRSGFEALSPQYGEIQVAAGIGALVRARQLGDVEVEDAARTFLRHEATIAALCVSDDRPVVVQPGGRIGKHIKVADGWTSRGHVAAERDYLAARSIGVEWHKQKGWGPSWLAETEDQRWCLDQEVPGLFWDAERAALAAWSGHGLVSTSLRSLIAPIRVAEGLHVAHGDGAHVAWMESLHSDGALRCQPLVASVRGESRFIVVDPPAVTDKVIADDHSTVAWVVSGRGGFSIPEILKDGWNELVIDSAGGRVLGEQPSEPPVEPGPVEPPTPGDDPRLNAEGLGLLADLRRIKPRLSAAEVRAHWIDPPGASAQRVLMGETILELLE